MVSDFVGINKSIQDTWGIKNLAAEHIFLTRPKMNSSILKMMVWKIMLFMFLFQGCIYSEVPCYIIFRGVMSS